MTTDIKPPALHWAPVEKLEWKCPCESCVANGSDSWHWRGEYSRADREVSIICIEDPNDYRDITLPAGYAICRLVQEGEKP